MFDINVRPDNEATILSNWKECPSIKAYVEHCRDKPVYARPPEPPIPRDFFTFYRTIRNGLKLTENESEEVRERNMQYMREKYGLDLDTVDHKRYSLRIYDYNFTFISDF